MHMHMHKCACVQAHICLHRLRKLYRCRTSYNRERYEVALLRYRKVWGGTAEVEKGMGWHR